MNFFLQAFSASNGVIPETGAQTPAPQAFPGVVDTEFLLQSMVRGVAQLDEAQLPETAILSPGQLEAVVLTARQRLLENGLPMVAQTDEMQPTWPGAQLGANEPLTQEIEELPLFASSSASTPRASSRPSGSRMQTDWPPRDQVARLQTLVLRGRKDDALLLLPALRLEGDPRQAHTIVVDDRPLELAVQLTGAPIKHSVLDQFVPISVTDDSADTGQNWVAIDDLFKNNTFRGHLQIMRIDVAGDAEHPMARLLSAETATASGLRGDLQAVRRLLAAWRAALDSVMRQQFVELDLEEPDLPPSDQKTIGERSLPVDNTTGRNPAKQFEGRQLELDFGRETDSRPGNRPAGAEGSQGSKDATANWHAQLFPEHRISGSAGNRVAGLNASKTEAQEFLRGNLIEQVSNHLKKELKPGATSVRIRLVPESLGTMDLRLQIFEGKLKAEVWVESREVKTLLESGIDALHKALQEKGLQVERLDIRLVPAAAEAARMPANGATGQHSTQGEREQSATPQERRERRPDDGQRRRRFDQYT